MFRIFLIATCCVPALMSYSQTESEKFQALLDEDWRYQNTEFPEFATYTGYPSQNGRWTDYSAEAMEQRRGDVRRRLEEVRAIDRGDLPAEERLNYDLFRKDLEQAVEGLRFKDEYLPVNQIGGVQQSLAMTIARMPRRSVGDYEDIVSRLEASGARIQQEVERLHWGLEIGVTPPAITLRDVPDQVQNQIVDHAEDSSLYGPFREFPADVSEADRRRLRGAATAAIRDVAIPAYRRMYAFLVNEYLPAARDSIAHTDLPDGEDWYAFNVRRETTTDLTPREIHELGLREVERIRGEMDRVIRESGFTGDFAEFCEFLRTDPRFYHTDAESLLRGYRDIAKRIDPELPKLFGTLPRLPYGVEAIPSYAEKSQTTAYYQPGSPAAGRAGIFSANTYALDTRPIWEMEALTVHEAVPGHHLQISIAQELEGVPEFRRWSGPTAFVEGWGLYSESLGEELGLYRDPYSKFGQLTYEIWRAVRLVVDTGMHALGWSRQDAIDYFAANSSKQLHDITVEIDRYIVWPGQALAYKIGELKFKELRACATEALGDDFNIRRFHDACLENGAIPLDILENHIDDWIEKEKARAETTN